MLLGGAVLRQGQEGLSGGGEGDCSTLELVCGDVALDLEVHLYYTAYEKLDAICRSARIVNRGSRPVKLDAALSACLDMDDRDFDLITLHGSWAYERMIQRDGGVRPRSHG